MDRTPPHALRTLDRGVQDAPYVENRRWHAGRVTYATLHVTGSDNNLGDVAPDPAEWAGRDAATNAWMRETFADARERRAAGVLLVIQANPGFDQADPARAGAQRQMPRAGGSSTSPASRRPATTRRRTTTTCNG